MPALQTYEGVYLWHYVPSLPLAITFTALFCLATTAHIWKLHTTKMWSNIPFVLGGIMEIIGYVFRAVSAYSTGELVPYIMQDIFLVLPPVFFAATLYMTYSHIVRAIHGEPFSPISMRWATRFFVTGDIVCLLIQGNAAGLLAKPETTKTGDYIIIAGLILQILIFVYFLICCLLFNMRFRAKVGGTASTAHVPWQACLNMLYVTSMAILARNIFRVVEFALQSVDDAGYLVTHEWPLYAFDGALMLSVMVVFFFWYPSQLHAKLRDSMVELTTSRSPVAGNDQRHSEGSCRGEHI
ncbi:RTA1 like protein-domain-containing protein [Penicillium desertorum]|uniref:RTA1 like protein-domain-containing protein n=1 Tax=Penicillium desertorum TaxID=1303715 RepID=A0A9X0BH55_9EURO|nr:RTA1 like protein-domain-containing protein [Penicillium desertorum]